MTHTNAPNKRHIYYIEKEFQAKFISQFCVLVAAGSLLTVALVYWLARHSTTVAIAQGRVAVRTTADYLLPLMTQTVFIQLIIVALATIVMTLLISHKIAGPLYHLRLMFKGLAEGDVNTRMHLRKGDQLQNVADDYTQAVEQLNQKIKRLKATTAVLRNKTQGMQDIKQDVEELEKILSTFKTS